MWGRAAIVAALAALLFSPAATGGVKSDAAVAKRGLTAAVASGRLPAEAAAEYRATVNRAVQAHSRLGGSRAANLAGAIRDAAGLAGRYDEPHGLILFRGLDENVRYFGNRASPAGTVDIEGEDGTIYRYFPSHGFQFHPLANFAKLNDHARRLDYEATSQLAEALLARAVRTRSGLAWEYLFPFGGGRTPWTSGMAQAVAAQAFARASSALGDPALLEPAVAAYATLPSLTATTSAGPWIRLYSFSSMLVLNAQLQAALSVREYARLAASADAQLFAERLEATALALLPRFDTGAWSLYALNGAEGTLHYHRYVVTLLKRLGTLTKQPEWADAATTFDSYLVVPPELDELGGMRVIYPRPRDGFRDSSSVTFTLSKLSTVRLAVGGDRKPVTLPRGRHTLFWEPGGRPPQVYAAKLVATDLAGNTAELPLKPIEVRVDTAAPEVSARLTGRRLGWRAVDDATPWVRLTVVLENGAGRRRIELGPRPLAGSALLRLPKGRWAVRLGAADSTGNRAVVPLGAIG
ncbi:MAG: D-glucuronyl C5-epimerase family protein [Gaiellaceae bacterium]